MFGTRLRDADLRQFVHRAAIMEPRDAAEIRFLSHFSTILQINSFATLKSIFRITKIIGKYRRFMVMRPKVSERCDW